MKGRSEIEGWTMIIRQFCGAPPSRLGAGLDICGRHVTAPSQAGRDPRPGRQAGPDPRPSDTTLGWAPEAHNRPGSLARRALWRFIRDDSDAASDAAVAGACRPAAQPGG